MTRILPWLPSLAVLLAAAASAVTPLEQAKRNYPPLTMGANTHRADGADPLPCPAAGARVEQKGGPAFEYLGAAPADPALCRMRTGTDTFEAWYGIWVTAWPGAGDAHAALGRIMHGRTGDIAAFDVHMMPGSQWHDLIRNEGVEDIRLLGTTYRALKISHYREGFGGNTYRSVSTVWKDIATGLLIYGTYQHIAGVPEIDDPLIPTAILPAK